MEKKIKLNKVAICLNGQIVEFSGEYTAWTGKTYPRIVPVASSIEEVKKYLGEVKFPCFLNIKMSSSDYFGWVNHMYWCTSAPDVCTDETIKVSSYDDIFESLKGLENELYYQYGNTETYEALKGVVYDPFTGKKIGEVDYEYDLTDIHFPPREVYEGNVDVDELISALRKAGHLPE